MGNVVIIGGTRGIGRELAAVLARRKVAAPARGAPVSDVDPFSPPTSVMHGSPKAKSSLVRRLVAARNDPAKRRIRAWLAECDDERLLGLGLTSDDIAILRGTRSGQTMSDHRTGRRVTDRAEIRVSRTKASRDLLLSAAALQRYAISNP